MSTYIEIIKPNKLDIISYPNTMNCWDLYHYDFILFISLSCWFIITDMLFDLILTDIIVAIYVLNLNEWNILEFSNPKFHQHIRGTSGRIWINFISILRNLS